MANTLTIKDSRAIDGRPPTVFLIDLFLGPHEVVKQPDGSVFVRSTVNDDFAEFIGTSLEVTNGDDISGFVTAISLGKIDEDGGGGSLDVLVGAELEFESALFALNFFDRLDLGNGSPNSFNYPEFYDTLNGPNGIETKGSAGDDVVEAGRASHTLSTGKGDDLILSDSGGFTLNAGKGTDTVDAGLETFKIVVDLDQGTYITVVNATLTGVEAVFGTAFDDSLLGDGKANELSGRDGADEIDGRAGKDTLTGNAGDDTVRGGDGNDLAKGDKGNDTLSGDGGKDTVKGGDGNDDVSGGNQDDDLSGGKGDDTVSGGKGADSINGDKGRDDLSGDEGADLINGGGGKDTLGGSKGDDTLNGGDGNDTLKGGGGSDTFVFGSGIDRAKDFDANSNAEKVDLSGVVSIKGFNDLQNNHMSQVGTNVEIDDLSGNVMVLVNTVLEDLQKVDFIF